MSEQQELDRDGSAQGTAVTGRDALGALWRAAADHAEPMIALRATRHGVLLPVWANRTFLDLVGRAPLELEPDAPLQPTAPLEGLPAGPRPLNPLDTAMLHAGAVHGVPAADPHLLAGLAGGLAAELIGSLVRQGGGQGFTQLERVDGVPVQVELTVRPTAATTHADGQRDSDHPDTEPLWLATLRPAGTGWTRSAPPCRRPSSASRRSRSTRRSGSSSPRPGCGWATSTRASPSWPGAAASGCSAPAGST